MLGNQFCEVGLIKTAAKLCYLGKSPNTTSLYNIRTRGIGHKIFQITIFARLFQENHVMASQLPLSFHQQA